MNALTRLLRNWLLKNDLPVEGVRLVLEFPKREQGAIAKSRIHQELAEFQLDGFGRIETMNGLGLVLRATTR